MEPQTFAENVSFREMNKRGDQFDIGLVLRPEIDYSLERFNELRTAIRYPL